MPAASPGLNALATRFPGQLSSDADARERYRVDGITPAAVFEPGTTGEVAEAIRWARENTAALLPTTSGLFLALGNPPAAADLAVSLRRRNRILSYDPGDLTLSVEAGITVEGINRVLAENRQWLPADPPFADRAAVSGLLSANINGPLRHAYGGWRDYVVGLTFVSGEGKVIRAGGRVVKNVAGYDMTRLLVGSLGTLGVITEVHLRIFPRPAETASFALAFDSLDDALSFRTAVMESPLEPLAMELLSRRAAALLGPSTIPNADWLLLLSCGGIAATVARHKRELESLASAGKVGDLSTLTGEAEASLWQLVRNFPAAAQRHTPCATAVRCPLPLTHLGPFLVKAATVAERYQLPWAATAHAGVAVATVWYLPQGNVDEELGFRIGQAATESIHAGNNLNGRVTIPWTFPAVKASVNIWGPLKDDFEIMRKLKAEFDPDRILNPGRFVGGL